jgi:hypothetical protein
MSVKTINFVNDFTDCPGGRLVIHGEYSGELFRDKYLKPALEGSDRVVLEMDGAIGFPSSFIDEVFGILSEQVGYDTLKSKLDIKLTDDPMALKEIEECMLAHKA